MDYVGGCGSLLTAVLLQCFLSGSSVSILNRDRAGDQTAEPTEGDVTCFSEYMETWIHRTRMEGLTVWLSGVLQSRVNVSSLEHLNLQLSACGFSLHKDPDNNFIFRVSYTGCLVQQQRGVHILKMNLRKRIHRFGGRALSLVMTCPVVSVLLDRERVQCDPEFIQVIRPVPYDNWNNELQWSLSLSDHFLVAVEDASLIQMSVDMNGSDISVQGRRSEVLSPVEESDDDAELLALKLVGGQFAYSMEAACPKVRTSTDEQTVLHIFKRCLGLTKRGSVDNGGLTVSNVSVIQTHEFTVHDTRGFVVLVIPTERILQTKTCAESKQLLQPFYRVDVVLTFKETNHRMHWSMENTLPCAAVVPPSRLVLLGLTSHSLLGRGHKPRVSLHSWTPPLCL